MLPDQTPKPCKFTENADKALDALYAEEKAFSIEEKIRVHEALDGEANFHSSGGEVTPEMKLGALEYAWLINKNLMPLVIF